VGEVYKPRDPRVGRDVAIKIPAAQFSECFEREARAIAQLNRPNICTLFDVQPRSGQIGNLPHDVNQHLRPMWRGFPTRERYPPQSAIAVFPPSVD
jgi:serine/threonine protein kinase